DLDGDRVLLGLAAGADQRDLLLAVGRRGRARGLDRLLGLDRAGERLIGLGLRVRLLLRLGGDHDRLVLVGDLDRLLAVDVLHLHRALGLDRFLLDLAIALDLGFLHQLLGADARLRRLAVLLGLPCRNPRPLLGGAALYLLP